MDFLAQQILGFGLVKAGGNRLFTELQMKGMRYLQRYDRVSDLNSLQSAAATNVNKLTTLCFGVTRARDDNLQEAQTARCLTVRTAITAVTNADG